MHYFSPLTPTAFLERSGRVYADTPAIRDRDHVVSYGELLRRSKRLASALAGLGVERSDPIGLMTDNCQQAIEANFGIPGAGGVVVSLNPWLPGDEIVKQLEWVNCRVLIVHASCLELHAGANLSSSGARQLIVICTASQPETAPGNLDYEQLLATAGEDVALDGAVQDELAPIVINFTSGTTGRPKGAVMSHRAAYLHALGQVLMLGLARESQYLWTLPMFHVNGWGHIWANAVVGAGQVILDLPEPETVDELRFSARVCQARVTHLAGAPRLLRRIVALEGAESALRGITVVTGGSAPPRSLLQQLDGAGVRLIHQYGLNETFGPYVVCEEQPGWQREDRETRVALRSRQGVAGMHVGTGLRVIAPDGCQVPHDGKTSGEVVMSGNTLALGYYGAEEATARAFVNGWFHSGDLAVVHPDGYLEIKDRIKDLIYVETDYGWENISSIEVENVLVQCPGVSDAALVGVPTTEAQQGAELVAVIEPMAQQSPSFQELRAFCEQHLPLHMRPSRFLLASIPKTATGKVRKDLLVERARNEPATLGS
jgi:fatty-acyl-CoA synthase